MRFDRIVMLPTWILLALVHPYLPRKHPWRRKIPTLAQWTLRATPLNRAFCILFWGQMVGFTVWGILTWAR